jgi:hypothetical protein
MLKARVASLHLAVSLVLYAYFLYYHVRLRNGNYLEYILIRRSGDRAS